MSGKKGMEHYPKEVKLEAVRMFFDEGMTRAEIAKAFGLRSVERVKTWTKQYRREGVEAFTEPIGRPRKVAESEQAELERLRMENTLLKNTMPNCARRCSRSEYRVIYKHREEYEVKAMCNFFGISRAAYYEWVKHSKHPDRDAERMSLVREAWQKFHKTYGYRRITIALQQQGSAINHKAVLRLMQKMNICSVARKRKPFEKVTQLDTYHRYENVLNRDFSASKPNQKWVTDISYVYTQRGWAYLSTIKDLFDGFIVAHLLGRENSVSLVTDTIKQAFQKEKITDEVLIHSDQGHQYTSDEYFVLTTGYHMKQSMSRRGNCWDNASMENFFGHFKEEALRQYPIPTFQEAQEIVDGYITFYNYERIQLKTRQTPYQTRCLSQ